MNVCPPRSREHYLAAIASLDVENDPVYSRGHLGQGLTWCNLFVHNATKLLECTVPMVIANLQCAWLATPSGSMFGWSQCEKNDAVVRANLGFPTIAGWVNPKPDGHGHIAMVVPAIAGVGLFIAQAGAFNFNNVPLNRGFGNLVPRFFTHP